MALPAPEFAVTVAASLLPKRSQRSQPPECVILCSDWAGSVALLGLLRPAPHAPVLAVPVRRIQSEVNDLLARGADDVLPGPWHPVELAWRVRNLVQRRTRPVIAPLVVLPLSLHVGQGRLMTPNGEVALSAHETAVLASLMRRPGIVRTRNELVDECWPEDVPPGPREVDYVVCALRRKLGRWSTFLATRPGFGYLFERPVSRPPKRTQ